MKKLNSLLLVILTLTLAACFSQPVDNAPRQDSHPPQITQADASAADSQSPTPDVFGTAIALDQATQAAAPPSPTPKPKATLNPNMDYWWNETVFYEIFVRSFYDSDGDGVGDINGLIQKLDYLNDGDPTTTDDLGITGLWLMPIMQSPSYHGYDVVDYYAVDNEYGTEEDFKRLMDEAHKRGIRVIVDLVINHTSVSHPWFLQSRSKDSEYRDWYIWSDTRHSYAGPWGQQVWHTASGSYYYGIFWSGMPDLNLRNPQTTAEIQAVAQFWLNDMGVDGFRLDAIKHLVENGAAQENTADTHAWLSDFYTFYKSLDPNAFAVGEAWTSTRELVEYTGDEVDIVFAFDLAEDFLNAARGPFAQNVSTRTAQMVESFPAGQYATFLANHDQNRAMSQLLGDVDQAKLAATLLLTSPGVPFIYYGEEIGMSGTKPDEDIRLPMQWTGDSPGAGFTTGMPWRPVGEDYPTLNVFSQGSNPASLLSHYRELIHLRNAHPALRTGEWLPLETGSEHIYAFLRYADEDILLILVNAHRETVSAGDYALTLESASLTPNAQAISLLGLENPASLQITSNGGFENYTPFQNIPAKGFAVLQLKP